MALRRKPPGEFELIARLVAGVRLNRRTLLGPGDDCAILAPERRPILFTIDSMVEGVHFRLDWGPPEKLGAKALAVNLSDIAAMGGRPTAFVVNLAVRNGLGLRFFDRLYAGLKALAAESETDLVGGNVTRSDRLAVTVALLGEVTHGPLTRDKARPGDEIFVTGTVGDSAAGVRILAGDLRARGLTRRFLVERHLSPTARIAAGQALARIRPTPAAIDLSDGLVQDLGHILERSGAGAEIDAETIPVSPAYRAVMGEDLALALGGGEDYELLFCLRPGHSEARLARMLGLPVHRIGRIVRGKGAIVMSHGRIAALKVPGWDQLRTRI